MNCEACKEHLIEYALGELDTTAHAEVERALAVCPDCAAELARVRRVLNPVVSAAPAVLEESRRGVVLAKAELAAARLARRADPPWYAHPSFLMAASALLAVGATVALLQLRATPAEDAGTAMQSVARSEAPPQGSPGQLAPVEEQAVVNEAGLPADEAGFGGAAADLDRPAAEVEASPPPPIVATGTTPEAPAAQPAADRQRGPDGVIGGTQEREGRTQTIAQGRGGGGASTRTTSEDTTTSAAAAIALAEPVEERATEAPARGDSFAAPRPDVLIAPAPAPVAPTSASTMPAAPAASTFAGLAEAPAGAAAGAPSSWSELDVAEAEPRQPAALEQGTATTARAARTRERRSEGSRSPAPEQAAPALDGLSSELADEAAVAAVDADASYDARLDTGITMYRSARYVEATALLEDLVASIGTDDPRADAAHFHLGASLYALGEHRRAQYVLERMLDRYPRSTYADAARDLLADIARAATNRQAPSAAPAGASERP